MNDVYLLDTNAAVKLLNSDPVVTKLIGEADEIYVPIIVVGELYYGAEHSGRVAENLKKVDEFAVRYDVLFCDLQSAREYGRIMQQLRIKGRTIRQNDVWIAAIAMQHSLTVLSQDAHFNDVDGLAVQGW